MKQKTGRKLLSFLLALAMVIGLIPGMSMTAYALALDGIKLTNVTAKNGYLSGFDLKFKNVEANNKGANGMISIQTQQFDNNNNLWGTYKTTFTESKNKEDGDFTPTTVDRGFVTWNAPVDGKNYFYRKGTATDEDINNPWMEISVTFAENVVLLNGNQTYYVYLWSYYQNYWYPDFYMGDIIVSNGNLTFGEETITPDDVTPASAEVSATVTFKVVNGSWNDETTTDKTVTLTGYEGDTLKLASNQIPAVGSKPSDTYKAGSWDVTPNTTTAITEATTYTYTYAAKAAQTITASDVTAAYGDTDKSVSASVTTPATGGGAISYAVKTGSENYIDVDASTGALTIKAVPPTDGKAYVIVTAAETDDYAETTKEVVVTISPATPVITLSDFPETYDGNPKKLISSVVYSGTEDLYLRVDCLTSYKNKISWAKYTGSSDLTNVFAPTNAGTYSVYYFVGTPDNPEGGTRVDGHTSIDKALPKSDNFTFTAPSSLNYDGTAKTATVTIKDGVIGMGEVTVRYYSDEDRYNEVAECKNPGTYYVGIDVGNGENYNSDERVYDWYDDSWKFTIAKADPTANAPTGLTATYGQTLADVTLPDGWTWADSTQSVGSVVSPAATFKANFAGNDNYNAASNVEVTVTVGKANPTAPTGLTATYGQTLANVTLPDGWTWADNTQSVGNVVDPAATFKANFAGDDNHNAASNVDVTVTVGKADLTAPTSLTATYGQTLANVTLPTGWTWADSTQSVGNVVDPAATFKANFTGNDNYNAASNVDVTVTVGKANAVAATVTANSRTYDGTEKPLVTVTGEATGGTMQYALGTATEATQAYTTSIPAKTDAGTYTVYYKVVGDANHNGTEAASVSVTIAKASAAATAPTTKNLTFTGEAQELVEAGSAQGGTMQYSLDGTTYSATVLSATDSGTYTVYYKVEGDANHNDTEAASVSVSIAKASAAVAAPTANTLTYSGEAQALVTAGSANTGTTMKYALAENGEYTAAIPTGTNAGDYTVWYKVEGGSNYNDTAPAKVDVKIDKATMTPTPTLQLVTMQQKTPKTAWVYGETDVVPDVTGNASGGVVTTFYSDGGSEMPTDAGTYTVWASIAATANYYGVERTNEVSFTITKAPHSDVTAAQTVTVSRNGVTDGKLDLGAYLADATGWTVKTTDGTLITAASNGGGTVLNYTAAQTAAVSSTGNVQITVTSKNYADYTLTVNFRTASAFTLRFETGGGTEIPSRILSENAAYGPLPTAEQVQRAGYIFDGWYTDAAFTAPATAETSIGSADATVYAKWTQITRTITLDLNGHGSIPGNYEKTVTDGKITYTAQDSDFTLPVLVNPEGVPTYTFGGWMKNGSDSARINVTIVVSDLENASYTAFWVVGEKVGEVTFEKGDAETGLMGLASMDEGTVSTGSGSTAEAGQAAKNLADVMKEVACEQGDAGDAENTVTVAMDLKPVDDTDPTKLDDHTREAMDKIKEASGSGDEAVKDDLVNISVTQTTTDENDAVVKQKPVPDIGRVVEIPLQYNLTGRYRPQIFHYHNGAAVAFTRLASRPVNSFTDGTFYVSGSGASAIIYIYTRYFSTYSITTTETPTHTVMFETNGGSEIGSVTVMDQQTLTRPGDPAKDSGDEARSYVFDGWYAASDFSTAYDFSAPVTRDMTLYAKWREIITYTVTLHRNDGTDATESRKTDENGKITLPAPTRSGYTLSGWYTAQTGGELVTEDTIYTADTGLYARWTQNSSGSYSGGGTTSTYTVNVTQAQNGTVKADKTNASSGSKVTLTVAPDQGFKLETLTVTDSSGKEITLTKASDGTYSFTMPAGNVTVKAIFIKEDAEPVPAEHPSYQECQQDAACPISAFTDADPKAWYHDGVHYVLDNGIMNGTGGGKFEPNTATTRAMVVTMLWRMEGQPEADHAMTFADVESGAWYAGAVRWAASNGIVSGYSDAAFGPNDSITREQLATILYRYAQSKGQGFTGSWMFLLDYPDAAEVSEWADEAMHWMVMNELIQGMDGKLNPRGEATRAQIATILMRYDALT